MNLFAGKKVLVVEDDEMLREMICDIFKSENAKVAEASNGAVALLMIQKDHFDVVLSDVRMPGGDGISLAENLFNRPQPKPLMFICSGFNDLSPEKAKALNVCKVFEKPFDHNVMLGEISRWLQK
jgi:two-component system response regulator FlrC